MNDSQNGARAGCIPVACLPKRHELLLPRSQRTNALLDQRDATIEELVDPSALGWAIGGIDGGQSVGDEPLGQCLDVAVAVDVVGH